MKGEYFKNRPPLPLVLGRERVVLVSPDTIRAWSSGEVTVPAICWSKRLRIEDGTLCPPPRKGGLYCERIFGPPPDKMVASFRDESGARVRVFAREKPLSYPRMGHIELPWPLAHPYFLKGRSTALGSLLGLMERELKALLEMRAYAVVGNTGPGPLPGELYRKRARTEPLEIKAGDLSLATGPLAVQKILEGMDLSKIIASEEEREARGGLCPRDLKASRRRRRSARAFMEARTSPAWMLMDVLPVLPQEQRPIVSRGKTDSGFDLNGLYKSILGLSSELRENLRLVSSGRRIHPQSEEGAFAESAAIVREMQDALNRIYRWGRRVRFKREE